MEYPFNNFFGQIGEDDKLVREGQVLYSEGLDLTSNVDFVTLSPLPELLRNLPFKGDVMYFIDRGIGKLVYADAQKNIYVEGDFKYAHSQKVKAFWSNQEFLYFIDELFDIYRVNLLYMTGTWTGNVVLTESGAEASDGNIFVIEGADSAYIAYGTKLYEVLNSTGQITNIFTFLYDRVAGLLDSRDVVEIVQEDGVVFSWDRTSDRAASYKLGIKVLKVIQSGDEKFIIGEGSYYIMSGGSLNKVAGEYSSDVLMQNKFKFGDINNVGFLKQVSYIASSAINPITDGTISFGSASVVLLGNKKSGFQPGISKYLNTSSGGTRYAEIYGIVTGSLNATGQDDFLFISYKTVGNVYGIDKVKLSIQNYITAREGILILPKFDGGNKNINKKLVKLKLRVDFGVTPDEPTPAGEFLLYKVVRGELVPFNGNILKSKVTFNNAGQNFKELLITENFVDTTFAVVLKQTVNRPKSTSLKFYSLTPVYEPIN